ncbi:MAG: hypothetical protein EAZ30_03630 [Betaproteobacteria bacterium]|nr:MAG: hypothetical protein EAZ30_03630 [Betaproteobacteria bacterium]
MSRLRAAAIHLLICAGVALVLLALFWLVWYPPPLFQAVGGVEIFLMLLGIDVILGPLLTLIVFKSGKKTLKFDLAVIGAVQVAALCYGVFTLLSGRPVYVAALGHRFDVIQANEIEEKELEAAKQSLPWFGPRWVGTKSANDAKEKERIMFSAMGGADYGHFPQHHQPLENMRDEILKNAEYLYQLKKHNAGNEAAIDGWLAERGLKPDQVRFQGLKGRSRDFTVVLDGTTAKVLGVAPFKPWAQ